MEAYNIWDVKYELYVCKLTPLCDYSHEAYHGILEYLYAIARAI